MDIDGIAGGCGGRKELITKTEEKLSSRSTWPHPRLPRGPCCQGKFGVCSGRCRCEPVLMPSLPLAACWGVEEAPRIPWERLRVNIDQEKLVDKGWESHAEVGGGDMGFGATQTPQNCHLRVVGCWGMR